jgi:hypothetical protein
MIIKPVNDADAINSCDIGTCDLGLFPAHDGTIIWDT